jgi:hypothetical protein
MISKYKNKEKMDVMVNGIPKFADDIKANNKSKEYNAAIVAVKQLETEKKQADAKQQLLMQALMVQQMQSELEKNKQQIATMLASLQPPLPQGGGGPGIYDGPQQITPDMMGQGPQGITPEMMQQGQGQISQPNPMMA